MAPGLAHPLQGAAQGDRRAPGAWADPLPLAAVKAIGKALGASVNDVLLSCVAGALRELSASRRATRSMASMLRALVPVDLQPMEKAYKLGNQFGLVFLDLPIGIDNPVERLYAVRAEHARAQGLVPAGADARPARRRWGWDRSRCRTRSSEALARNATGGDDQRARAAGAALPGAAPRIDAADVLGAAIRATSAWGCRSLSYNGAVQFGLITDRGLVSRPASTSSRPLRPRVRASSTAEPRCWRRDSRERRSRPGKWTARAAGVAGDRGGIPGRWRTGTAAGAGRSGSPAPAFACSTSRRSIASAGVNAAASR